MRKRKNRSPGVFLNALRALQILKSRLPEIEALAHQLFNQRRVEALTT